LAASGASCMLLDREGLEWQRPTVGYFPVVEWIVATADAIGAVSVAHAQSKALRREIRNVGLPRSRSCEAHSSPTIVPLMALGRSGRFRVTQSTAPSRMTLIVV